MATGLTLATLQQQLEGELPPSDWLLIDQQRINQFAEVTQDHQFIHIDPEQAAKTPFGGTIAHGFLTLSLLSHLGSQVISIDGAAMSINYGFDKLRFINPVKVGSRIRAHFSLDSIRERASGQFQIVYEVSAEIEGEEKPALIASWVSLVISA